MSRAFQSRRRAEEFNAALEGLLESPATHSSDHSEALALVGALRAVTPVEPRSDFVSDLRGRLMAEADVALSNAPDTSVRSRSSAPRLVAPKRERRLAAAVGSFALVGATASMAVAAQGALPGETLYPLKRALENAQTSVQGDDDSKGATLLANATGRLVEIDELSREDDTQDPAVISSTLDTFADQATEASDLLMDAYLETGRPELIDDVRVFAAESMGALRALEPLVPRESRAALIQASQVLREIDKVAMDACPTCSAVFIDQVPLLSANSFDDLITDLVESAPLPSGPATKGDDKTRKGPKKSPDANGSDDVEVDKTEPPVPVPTDPPTKLPPADGKGPKSDPKPPKGPIQELTDTLLGGGNTSGPGLDDVVEDTIKNLTDPLLP